MGDPVADRSRVEPATVGSGVVPCRERRRTPALRSTSGLRPTREVPQRRWRTATMRPPACGRCHVTLRPTRDRVKRVLASCQRPRDVPGRLRAWANTRLGARVRRGGTTDRSSTSRSSVNATRYDPTYASISRSGLARREAGFGVRAYDRALGASRPRSGDARSVHVHREWLHDSFGGYEPCCDQRSTWGSWRM